MKIFILTLLCTFELLANVGKVYALKGIGTIIRDTKPLGLSLGMEIEEKDIIKTSKKTKVQIIFKDKTIITLGRNSHFIVENYLFDQTQDSKADFRLKKGVFKAVTGLLGKIAPHKLKVLTKNATIGIRGTSFVVRATKTHTILATISGTTTFSDTVSNTNYVVTQNTQLTQNLKTSKVKIKPLDQRTIRLGKRMVKSSQTQKVAKQSNQGSSVMTKQNEEGSSQDVASNNLSALQDGVASVQNSYKHTLRENSNFSYGYWANSGIAMGAFAEGIALTSATVSTYASNLVFGYYSGGVVGIRDGVASSNGNFNITADFQGFVVTGTMQFTDSNNEIWAASLSSAPISGNGFTASGGAQINQNGGTVALDLPNMSVDGTFYGTGTSQPVISQDALGGTFSFTGTDSAGITTTTVGSFGGTVDSITGGL